MKKAVVAPSSPLPKTSVAKVTPSGPLKEIVPIASKSNDYDLDYIPRAIYNNQVDELLLREEGMSGRIQSRSKKRVGKANSRTPGGTPRFNSAMSSQTSTPNISRTHSRNGSANPSSTLGTTHNNHPSDPSLAATESRMVILTDLGIEIVTPAYLSILQPLPKAFIANPQDTPVHIMGFHKALPQVFPRTIRAATWKNTLAGATESVIEDARKACVGMDKKRDQMGREFTLRYTKPVEERVGARKSGLSFRGRGVLEEQAKRGAVEGMGKRAPVETVYAKSVANECVVELETSVSLGAGRRSRNNSHHMGSVSDTIEFKSPLFSKAPIECAEPVAEELHTSAAISGFKMNEEVDVWAAASSPSLSGPKATESNKSSLDNVNAKYANSVTSSDEWLANERKKMNTDWGRDAGRESKSTDSKTSSLNSLKKSLATGTNSNNPMATIMDVVKPVELMESDAPEWPAATTIGVSSSKTVDSFLKQFETKPNKPAAAAEVEEDAVLSSFNKMMSGSIEVLSDSESSSDPFGADLNASMITQTSAAPPKIEPLITAMYPGIEGFDEPNWGDVVSTPSGIAATTQSAKLVDFKASNNSMSSDKSIIKTMGESNCEGGSGSKISIASGNKISTTSSGMSAKPSSQPVSVSANAASAQLLSHEESNTSNFNELAPSPRVSITVNENERVNHSSASLIQSPGTSMSKLSHSPSTEKKTSGIKSAPLSLKPSMECLKEDHHESEEEEKHEKKHGFGHSMKSLKSGLKNMVTKMKGSSSHHSLSASDALKADTPKGNESPRNSISRQASDTPSPDAKNHAVAVSPKPSPRVSTVQLGLPELPSKPEVSQPVVLILSPARETAAQEVNKTAETKVDNAKTNQPSIEQISSTVVPANRSGSSSSIPLKDSRLPKPQSPVAQEPVATKETPIPAPGTLAEKFKPDISSSTFEVTPVEIKTKSTKSSTEKLSPPAASPVEIQPESLSKTRVEAPQQLSSRNEGPKVTQKGPTSEATSQQIPISSVISTTTAPTSVEIPQQTNTKVESQSISAKVSLVESSPEVLSDAPKDSLPPPPPPAPTNVSKPLASPKGSPRVGGKISKLTSAFETNAFAAPTVSEYAKERANKSAAEVAKEPATLNSNPNTEKLMAATAVPIVAPSEPPAPPSMSKPTPAPVTNATRPNKGKYMNAMDMMLHENKQDAPSVTGNQESVAPSTQTPISAPSAVNILHKNSEPKGLSTEKPAVVVGLSPAEKEKLRVTEAGNKIQDTSSMVQSAQLPSNSPARASEVKKIAAELPAVKLPSAQELSGKAVCEKIKCEIKFENNELSCVDEKKREVFPTLELHRIVKAEFHAGKSDVTLHACVQRDKGKSGSKFREIEIKFDEGPAKAKVWAEGIMTMVYGAVTPEKAILRKVICLVDRFEKEPPKLIEKYMKPVWAVFGKEVEIKSVQFMELSVNNAIAEEAWHNVSNVVVMSSEFTPKLLQILVKNGYADEPVDLPVDEDPVDAALAILKCEYIPSIF
ncbi:hypothetical protein HDU98_007924 [Podochytrium sp. JEL0797]|nr:hypothetical protein HDU98_007924 [Podochytrium sp. JEL0797]